MKSKSLFIIYIFLFTFNIGFSQIKPIKKGAYMNLIEFRDNSPSLDIEFNIRECYRNYTDSPKHPKSIVKTNIYKIRSKNKKIKKRIINKKIWGIYDGENFYLNGYKYGYKHNLYFKILEMGEYAYFIGNTFVGDMPLDMQRTGAAYGVIGYTVASSIYEHRTMNDNNFIINMKTGMVHNLTKNYLSHLLESEPDIKEQYDNEKQKDDLNIKLNYLRKLNKRLENK